MARHRWVAPSSSPGRDLEFTLLAVPDVASGDERTIARQALALRRTPSPVEFTQARSANEVAPNRIIIAAGRDGYREPFLSGDFSDVGDGIARELHVESLELVHLRDAAEHGASLGGRAVVRVSEIIRNARGTQLANKRASYGVDGKLLAGAYRRYDDAGHLLEAEVWSNEDGTGEKISLEGGEYVVRIKDAGGDYVKGKLSYILQQELPSEFVEGLPVETLRKILAPGHSVHASGALRP